MNSFTLQLQSASELKTIEQVTTFVGEDRSGSFSLMSGHCHFMTALVLGLARFRQGQQPWQYLAVPGAVLNFIDNRLVLSCRRFLIDSDYQRISAALQQQLLAEEEQLHSMKASLRRMEDEFLKRMWEMGRRGGASL